MNIFCLINFQKSSLKNWDLLHLLYQKYDIYSLKFNVIIKDFTFIKSKIECKFEKINVLFKQFATNRSKLGCKYVDIQCKFLKIRWHFTSAVSKI